MINANTIPFVNNSIGALDPAQFTVTPENIPSSARVRENSPTIGLVKMLNTLDGNLNDDDIPSIIDCKLALKSGTAMDFDIPLHNNRLL